MLKKKVAQVKMEARCARIASGAEVCAILFDKTGEKERERKEREKKRERRASMKVNLLSCGWIGSLRLTFSFWTRDS